MTKEKEGEICVMFVCFAGRADYRLCALEENRNGNLDSIEKV